MSQDPEREQDGDGGCANMRISSVTGWPAILKWIGAALQLGLHSMAHVHVMASADLAAKT
jgi:hypothetical protein